MPFGRIALALLLCLQLGANVFADETSEHESAAKIARLLEASGYKYKKAPQSDSVWTIDCTGKSLSSFKALMATQGGMLIVGVVIAEKKNLPMTNEFMQKLLRFNHNLDRVKVGIDDDGDLFVRVELSVRTLDAEEFKVNVDQVATAADEIYAGIKQDLVDSAP